MNFLKKAIYAMTETQAPKDWGHDLTEQKQKQLDGSSAKLAYYAVVNNERCVVTLGVSVGASMLVFRSRGGG